MSETLVLEPELEAAETSGSNQEIKDPTWGDELKNYVLANQDVIVICPWMGGAKVSLGEAMWAYNYPPNMTEADVPAVMAVVNELLANRVLEQEEPEETKEQSAEDETLESEETDLPKKEPAKIEPENFKQTQKSNTERPSAKSEIDVKLATTLSQTAKPAQQTQPKAEETAPANIDKAEKIKSAAATLGTETPAKIERADNSSKVSVETPRSVNPDLTETVTVATSASETTAKYSADSEASPSLVSDNEPIISQPELAATTSTRIRQPDSDLEISQTGAIDLSGKAETEDEPGFPEIEVLQELDIPQESIDLTNDDEILQENIEVEMRNYGVPEEGFLGLAEQEEILIDHHDEIITQTGESLIIDGDEAIIIQLNYEMEPQERLENDTPENLASIVLKIEKIENTLIQVVEQIETAEPKTAEIANIILDKISELTAKLEWQTDNESTKSDAQQELEILFTRLFEQLGIEYTPGLVQSLVRLTFQRHSTEKDETLVTEEDNETSQDRGTHEIIKKLLAIASKIKKAMWNATAIGKSALRLYTYDFPAELRKRLTT